MDAIARSLETLIELCDALGLKDRQVTCLTLRFPADGLATMIIEELVTQDGATVIQQIVRELEFKDHE